MIREKEKTPGPVISPVIHDHTITIEKVSLCHTHNSDYSAYSKLGCSVAYYIACYNAI